MKLLLIAMLTFVSTGALAQSLFKLPEDSVACVDNKSIEMLHRAVNELPKEQSDEVVQYLLEENYCTVTRELLVRLVDINNPYAVVVTLQGNHHIWVLTRHLQ